MSYLWAIRLVLIVGLFIYLALSRIMLRERKRYRTILESSFLNFIFVVVYNALCYLAVGIHSDPRVIKKPSLFEVSFVTNWYSILGQVLFVGSALLLIYTVTKRKAIGAQDTGGRLLSSGVYSFTRHPIYLGIVLISLGIAIVRVNFDGMIVFPVVFLANFIQAKLEEVYDVGVRFIEEYQHYKRRTRMFAPLWFWIVMVILLIAPLVIAFTKG